MPLFGASYMNKSALALAGFGFAVGLVLFIVVEPLMMREPSATPSPQPAAAIVAKPTVQTLPAAPSEPFPGARRAVIRILKDPEWAKFGVLFERSTPFGQRIICGEVNDAASHQTARCGGPVLHLRADFTE